MSTEASIAVVEPASRRRTFLRIGVPVLLFLLLFVAVPCLLLGYFVTRTSSEGRGDITASHAAAVFDQRRAACEQLRDMLVEDRVLGYLGDEVVPDRRGALYERLLRDIGAYDVVAYPAGSHPWSCEILLASHGTFFHQACTAFVFVPDGVVPRDRPMRGEDPAAERFTALGDGWFLYCYTL